MKKIIIYLFLTLIFSVFLFGGTTDTQAISVIVSEIKQLVLVDGANFSMTIGSTSAGAAPASTPNTSQYLRYSSIVASLAFHKITVTGSGQTAPTATTLTVQAAIQAGGAGSKGTAQGEITIATAAAFVGGDLIRNIAGCFTGTAAGNGAQLTYRFKVATMTGLFANTGRACTVTYTMVTQ